MKKSFVLLALVMILFATPAMAKEGFYLGGFLQITRISGESNDVFDQSYFDSLDPGLGLGLRVGYGFNRYVSLEGSLFLSSHQTNATGPSGEKIENQALTGQTVDLKLHWPLRESNAEPYFLLGVGAYQLGDSGGTYYKGGGYQFGGGIDIYLQPEVSLNLGLTWRKITFDDGDFHYLYDTDADITTFDVGITYHFL